MKIRPSLLLPLLACSFLLPLPGWAETVDFYIDARLGDDANPGTREAPLRSLPEEVKEGTHIGLARGSVWRGTWNLPAQVLVDSYGEGEAPIITGYSRLDPSSAEPVADFPGVFRFVVEGGDAIGGDPRVRGFYVGDGNYAIEDTLFRVHYGREHTPQALHKATREEALAWVADNPGWFFYDVEDGEHHFLVNSGKDPRSDDRHYEFKQTGPVLSAGDHSEIRNVRLIGTTGRNGVVSNNRPHHILWRDVEYQDGGLHNMLAGNGRGWIDVTSIGHPQGPHSLFHLYNGRGGSPGAVYARTRAIGSRALDGSQRTAKIAYYDHDSKVPNIVMLDVESQGAQLFYNYGANGVAEGGKLIISGARVNDKAGTGERRGLPPAQPYGSFSGGVGGGGIGPNRSILIENVVAYLGDIDGILLGAEEDEYIFRNSIIIYRPVERGGSLFGIGEKVNARFEHCTFIIDTYGEELLQPSMVNGPLRWGMVQVFDGAEGRAHFDSCVFVMETPITNFSMHFPHDGEKLAFTFENCLISPGFGHHPKEGGTQVSDDIFAAPRGWRNGDFTLSITSPAHSMDAGYRADRPAVFREQAEALAKEILGFVP